MTQQKKSIRKFKLRFAVSKIKPGSILYEKIGSSLAAMDDERLTGIPHITLTYDPRGVEKGFTLPIGYVEELSA